MVQSVLWDVYWNTVLEGVLVVVVVVVVVIVVVAAVKTGILGATCNFVIGICLPSRLELLVVELHRIQFDGFAGVPQLIFLKTACPWKRCAPLHL